MAHMRAVLVMSARELRRHLGDDHEQVTSGMKFDELLRTHTAAHKPPKAPTAAELAELGARVKRALFGDAGAVIEACQELARVKSLHPGEWEGKICGQLDIDPSTGRRLVAIGTWEYMKDRSRLERYLMYFPPSWTTLYPLTLVPTAEELDRLVVSGEIHPGMVGPQAVAIARRYKPAKSSTPARVSPTAPATVTTRMVVGDAVKVLAAMPAGSVNAVITSPPYLAKRSYLPNDHPDKAAELGQETTPAEYLAHLLAVTDELWRVLADDGTIWFVLGDTASHSGGAGGDYNADGLREGQPRYAGSALRRPRDSEAWPLAKSVCWMPQLFGASLAYGSNLLTGAPCRRWVTRPPVTWTKPNPSVGEILDKFREATELIVWAAKSSKPRGYYFDLDAVRTAPTESTARVMVRTDRRQSPERLAHAQSNDYLAQNPKGAPPLDWWVVSTQPYPGAHYAVFPEALVTRPLIAACPPGGVVLDPFCGSGTTLAVAAAYGRHSIGVDLDERNVELTRQRVGRSLQVVGAEELAP